MTVTSKYVFVNPRCNQILTDLAYEQQIKQLVHTMNKIQAEKCAAEAKANATIERLKGRNGSLVTAIENSGNSVPMDTDVDSSLQVILENSCEKKNLHD